jgi:uncharacterized protein (DUF2126 family)
VRRRDIVRYWQHHPALAYFFTGQYVGPGSQAPRADEAYTPRQETRQPKTGTYSEENFYTLDLRQRLK